MDDDTLTGVGLDYDDESAITPEGPLPGLSLPIPARVAAIVAIAFIVLVIARRSFKGAFNS
jgi:hypothetical protein